MIVIAITVLIKKAANYLDIPGLLDLVCKEYARRIRMGSATLDALSQLPPELVSMVLEEYLHYFRDHSVVGGFLIVGGIDRDRVKKAKELCKEIYAKHKHNIIVQEARRTGICFFGNRPKHRESCTDLDLLQQITQIGNILKSKAFREIDLGSYIRQDLTPIAIDETKMTIKITSAALVSCDGFEFELSKEALDSVKAALEQSPRDCCIEFKEAKMSGGIEALPCLPKTVKTLTLRHLDAFPLPFPSCPSRDEYYIPGLVEKFHDLERIRFENCVVRAVRAKALASRLPTTHLEYPADRNKVNLSAELYSSIFWR